MKVEGCLKLKFPDKPAAYSDPTFATTTQATCLIITSIEELIVDKKRMHINSLKKVTKNSISPKKNA
jgi:hypothetical protein